MIFVRSIQRVVAEQHDLPVETMTAPTRCAKHAQPRQIAMTLSTILTAHSTVTIGRLFKRDHSTVVHARNATFKRCADPKVSSAMRQAARRILLEEAGQ